MKSKRVILIFSILIVFIFAMGAYSANDNPTYNEIVERLGKPYMDGLSLLGGDPFASFNIDAVYELLKRLKTRFPNLNIWVWTGMTFETIINTTRDSILRYIDVLVDGPFVQELKSDKCLYRGSTNQRLIDVKKTLEQNHKVVLWDAKR